MGIFEIESWVDLFGLCKKNLGSKKSPVDYKIHTNVTKQKNKPFAA